jgi:hypothetical protein
MPILRIERHESDYTCVWNPTINDKRLSFRARGILLWLLSKPNGWEVNKTAIARAGKESAHGVDVAFAELYEYGYLTQEPIRGKDGRLAGTTIVVSEDPGSPRAEEIEDSVNRGLNKTAPLISTESLVNTEKDSSKYEPMARPNQELASSLAKETWEVLKVKPTGGKNAFLAWRQRIEEALDAGASSDEVRRAAREAGGVTRNMWDRALNIIRGRGRPSEDEPLPFAMGYGRLVGLGDNEEER